MRFLALISAVALLGAPAAAAPPGPASLNPHDAGHGGASAPPGAVSPGARLDGDLLDRLFDGSGELPPFQFVGRGPEGRAAGPILRAEHDPLPIAPRYALNLDAVPERYRHTIPGFERLPHKNQEETPEWVDHINGLIRLRNARRGLFQSKIPEWTYDGRPNEPVWSCLAHSAATVNDWWALQMGRSLEPHRSAEHGGTELGTDPHALELEYYRKAAQGHANFVVPPTFVQEDPVRHTGFPYEPRGYAELLVKKKGFSPKDPVTGEKRRFKPGESAMEGEWLQLFTNSPLEPRTPDRYARVLAQGIDKFGIAYTQLEHTDHPRWPGAHSVAAVGYFCMEPGERLIDCAHNRTDEDWGRTTWFIIHDSFGNFPADKIRAADGASAYIAVRIGSVDQAIVFPHGLKVAAEPDPGSPGVWRLSAANMGGLGVEVLFMRAAERGGIELPVVKDIDGSFFVSAPSGAEIEVYVEAKHYYDSDGRGRVYALSLDARAAVNGVPVPRQGSWFEQVLTFPDTLLAPR